MINNILTYLLLLFFGSGVLFARNTFPERSMISSVPDNRIPVILDTDGNHSVDDQHAIAYLIFSQGIFDIKGITTNRTMGAGTIKSLTEEVNRVVKMCGEWDKIPVLTGADKDFNSIKPHLKESDYDGNEAVNFIIRQAHENHKGKLVLIAIGKITNIALAIEKDPSIIPKIKVVWLGTPWPCVWKDPNKSSDIPAANYMFDSEVEFQIVSTCESSNEVKVSVDEMFRHMPGKGPYVNPPIPGRSGGLFHTFGDYSVNLFESVRRDGVERRPLYDIVAIATLKNPDWGNATVVGAPLLNMDDTWVKRDDNPRKVTFWQHYDTVAVLNDFWETMDQPVLGLTTPYENLLDHRSGFAKDVTGGAGGKLITISAIGEEGFKRLKIAVAGDKPKWIRFSPGMKGSILIDGKFMIGSNTTIDGRDADITFEGVNDADEIYIDNKKNVIIHNITFYRIGHVWDKGGALSLVNGADMIWIDHVTFSKNSDESLSMGTWHNKSGKTAGRITVSFCLFDQTPKAILAGWGPDQGEGIRLTVHHTSFTNLVSRIPLLRHGWVHFYNNCILDAGWSAIEIHEDAQALVENNYLRSTDTVMDCGTNRWDTEPGWICEHGNILTGGAYKVGTGFDCDKVFKASDYYNYTLDPANKGLCAILMIYAGRSPDPQWDHYEDD